MARFQHMLWLAYPTLSEILLSLTGNYCLYTAVRRKLRIKRRPATPIPSILCTTWPRIAVYVCTIPMPSILFIIWPPISLICVYYSHALYTVITWPPIALYICTTSMPSILFIACPPIALYVCTTPLPSIPFITWPIGSKFPSQKTMWNAVTRSILLGF
jgi:hypothetical protein